MSWIPPKSPYNLIQEHLWHDPWKIFVACIFCNLTKRVDAEPYMWKFFDLYPDAKSASIADPKTIEKMIKPLGLSQRRSVALVRMSDDYLKKQWKNKPDVLYGIGKYASDAYMIFCLGKWKSVEPKDTALNDYHTFLKSCA
jgi:methyl-CpG-binding domain protein 4|tara:strand:+ start:13085 stop:13507 length:423 start_codon:yes stop_codon:yes gene_type:complete